jgi:carbamoyl-phosphate synthase small subunit
MKLYNAILVTQDGQIFEGFCTQEIDTPIVGEVVFNTVISGYQEVMTDPSYEGQIICFTYPHIGNYGVNEEDNESSKVYTKAIIARDICENPSNFRSQKSLPQYLRELNVPCLFDIDTRALTRLIRQKGSMNCAIGNKDPRRLLELAKNAPGTIGQNLVKNVTSKGIYTYGDKELSVVAYDYGIKTSTLRKLAEFAKVTVVPADTPAQIVLNKLDKRPDGILLSNGPGDPAACDDIVTEIRKLIDKVPMFGICLGHQLLGLAVGAKTVKLAFGHHGGNHPVKDLVSGRVEITSQNHNYAIDEASLPKDAKVTHVNLNDGVLEGFRISDLTFSVQFHPEAGPGPHDCFTLFDQFLSMIVEYAHG